MARAREPRAMEDGTVAARDLSAVAPPSSPRGAHLEMVGAVLAGDGLERVAEIASSHAGAPVAVIVPRLGVALEKWGRLERYVSARLAGARPEHPGEVHSRFRSRRAGASSGRCCCSAAARPDSADYLHMAAIAALTEVAVAEARDETEQSLRGSFLEEVLSRPELEPAELLRRAVRLGCDLDAGYVALCADPNGRGPGRLTASVLAEAPGALAQTVDGKVYALLPGEPELARRAAARLSRHAAVGVSSHRSGAAELRRALEEAELVLGVTAAGGGPPGGEIGEGTYRLLFRVLASHPQEVRSFYEDTVAALVRYDEQYATDLVGTLAAYLDNNCNMAATAQAIHAHRHTVGYRLDRVKELSGLDPLRARTASASGSAQGVPHHRPVAAALRWSRAATRSCRFRGPGRRRLAPARCDGATRSPGWRRPRARRSASTGSSGSRRSRRATASPGAAGLDRPGRPDRLGRPRADPLSHLVGRSRASTDLGWVRVRPSCCRWWPAGARDGSAAGPAPRWC